MLESIRLKGLLTIPEAAALKGVSLSTVYKAVREGRLRTQRVLGRNVLRSEDVRDWSPSGHGGLRRPKSERALSSPDLVLAKLIRQQGVPQLNDPADLYGDFTAEDFAGFDSALQAWRDERGDIAA